jgi:hypothetical protein
MNKDLNNNCGFDKGWSEAKQRLAELKDELKKVLDVKTEATFGLYKNGKTKMGYAQRVMVQQVFEKYGITNPFGEATEN